MKEIVVVSGQGGTGKTSFAAAFAELAEGPVALGDCDVDAANLGLLLPGEEVWEEPFFAGQLALVNGEACTDCRLCGDVCRYDAITFADGAAIVHELRCEGCGACMVVCPARAIHQVPVRAGTVFRRETAAGPLVHAALGIARDHSGKLVARVREEVRRVGEERMLALAILDGPPGIGCSVHAAVGRTDLVVAVTEPSPSGRHDLERLLDLTARFDLPAALVINKADLNAALADEIETMAAGRGARPLGRVPFDDDVPRVLGAGRTPLAVPRVRDALEGIWAALRSSLP